MALFDLRKLENVFHKPQTPHAAETHAPTPTPHAPTPAAIPRAIPVAEPVKESHPAPTPVVNHAPTPAGNHAPAPTPTPATAQTPTPVPAGTQTKTPGLTEEEQRALVTDRMESLKENKTILKPGQKGPEVIALQQQLKQLGLHVEQNGVMDKSTEGYIMAIQTGGGLGADGVVGPKTIDQLLKLDQAPEKPAAAGDNGAEGDNVDHMPDDPKLAAVYLYNRQRVKNAKESLDPSQQRDMEQFIKNWDKNKVRYEEVAATAGIPAKMVASLHWRESTGDFGTYLHQGDPLGKKAVHEPSFDQGTPIFKEWEPAAEHALEMKKGIKKAYKIDQDTTDEAALASYAERYNGLGYHNYHSMASPYVFAGTDQYAKGKYRSDGAGGWDNNYKDTQLGVIPMMRNIDQHEKELAAKAAAAKKLAEGEAPAAEQHDDKTAPPNLHFAQ